MRHGKRVKGGLGPAGSTRRQSVGCRDETRRAGVRSVAHAGPSRTELALHTLQFRAKRAEGPRASGPLCGAIWMSASRGIIAGSRLCGPTLQGRRRSRLSDERETARRRRGTSCAHSGNRSEPFPARQTLQRMDTACFAALAVSSASTIASAYCTRCHRRLATRCSSLSPRSTSGGCYNPRTMLQWILHGARILSAPV